MTTRFTFLVLIGLLVLLGRIPTVLSEDTPKSVALVAFDDANRQRAAENANLFVQSGLVADRRAGEIHILGQSTGIRVNDPMEFLLISPKSGHDYESLAMTFCDASALYEAFAFLGITPGRPIDPQNLVFWPKGERVGIQVECRDTNVWAGRIDAEFLIKNVKTESPVVASGFIFSGSRWVENEGKRQYLPDVSEPHSIVSLYNEPATVLDVPRQAQQNELYDSIFPNPEFAMPTNILLDIYLTPQPGRIVDIVAEVVLSGTNAATLGDLVVRMEATSGDSSTEPLTASLSEIVLRFSEIAATGKDLFVSFLFSRDIPLGLIHQVCTVIAGIEGEEGVRVEPPAEGRLYYRAFLPDERHRKREERISQPWELRFYPEGSTNRHTLTQIKENWIDGQIRPELEPVDHPVDTPADLRKKLDELGPGLPVILIYAPPELQYATLLNHLEPVLPTHGIIHVFLENGVLE